MNANPISLSNRNAVIIDQVRWKSPWWFWPAAGASIVLAWFSANPWLTAVAIIVLVSSIKLLWRKGEPPALAFACGMQWLQAATVIFYADLYKAPLTQAAGVKEFETATWLSIIAVLTLALGMRLALVRSRSSSSESLTAESLRVSIVNLFIAYLITLGIATVADRYAFSLPAVRQIITAFISIKWVCIFLLAYCVVEQRAGYVFLTAVVAIEIGVGMISFFGGFKDVLFVLLVAALTSPLAFRGRRLAIPISIGAALFFLGVVWSAIKAEYREFLNQGTGEQVVLVSPEESIGKLGDLIGNFTWDNFTDGFDRMMLRIGYTNYFALTLMNVPENVPYENGALWLGTLKHIVTPRLFFPEKGEISDSERTTLYTGIQTAGVEEGTSIGIGYVAESYVDFGPIWMFAPIFLLGVFYGLIYRFFVIHSHPRLIGAAIASAILIFNGYKIESSNIKIVGGAVTALLVIGSIYLLFGPVFSAWLQRRPAG